MTKPKTCGIAGCRLPAIHASLHCWEHITDIDQYRQQIEKDVLDGVDFTGAIFIGADLRGLNLSGIKAVGADFTGADLYKVSFAGGSLAGANFNRSRMNYTSFDIADLRGSCLNNSIGKMPSFIGANMEKCQARYSVITDANLSEAGMNLSDWQGATMSFCDLTHVKANRIHAPWTNLMGSILKHGEFEFAVLGGSMLDGVQASGADFKRSNLLGVSARAATFRDCNFYYARMTAGIFIGADFAGADLSRAVLRTASFYDAVMDGVKMENAVLDRAKF